MLLSNVIVARDDKGVYAMSRACTHQGCAVDDTSSGSRRRAALPLPRVGVRRQRRGHARSGRLAAAALRGHHRRRRDHDRRGRPARVGRHADAGRLSGPPGLAFRGARTQTGRHDETDRATERDARARGAGVTALGSMARAAGRQIGAARRRIRRGRGTGRGSDARARRAAPDPAGLRRGRAPPGGVRPTPTSSRPCSAAPS